MEAEQPQAAPSLHTTLLKLDPASFPYPPLSDTPKSVSDPSDFAAKYPPPPHVSPFNLHPHAPSATYQQDLDALNKAALILKENDPSIPPIVAFPTETVYGLGANATSERCISAIFKAKGRPSDNPLIVHVSSFEMLESLLPPGVPLPDIYRPILTALWPGPLTILLPRGPSIPTAVTAGHPSVAVRMPSSPIARALIDRCGFPIAAPSANTSGRPSPTAASHVLKDLNGRVALILDGGDAQGGVESTVLDGLSDPPAILRPGGVTFEDLQRFPGMERLRVYRKDFVDSHMEAAPVTPGMKYRHYSPRMEVVLFELSKETRALAKNDPQGAGSRLHEAVDKEAAAALKGAAEGSRVGIMRTTRDAGFASVAGNVIERFLGDASDPATVAHNLFSGLRELEDLGVVVILVEGIEEEREGLAVMNRLRKASSRTVVV
ncbi:hypothetical protein HDU96_008791 [Phlyctochytrium bullatum]|nr:hypothetical protein HDU96_008791 [Phlyctochytrium bullatum]